jgi:hypothetical protein
VAEQRRQVPPWLPSPRALLRGALWVLAAVVTAASLVDLLTLYPPHVDAEIPLRAAGRWLAGGEPYLASSFDAPVGYDLPFLYPPPILVLVAPLTELPRELVWGAWTAGCAAAGVVALRWLGVRWLVVPLVLAWPPFAEAIIGCNLQVVVFAAFVVVFWNRGGTSATESPAAGEPRTLAEDCRDGVLVGLTPALKISQPHAWVALARWRPRAAVAGAGILLAIALATLPLTGIELWRSWLAQLGRAADPSWELAGASLTSGLTPAFGLAVLALSVIACLVAPLPRLGAWSGVMTVVGAPSLRMFGVLFAVPAMLVIRRELALVAATLIATYTLQGLWLGIVVILGALLAAERYAAFREPTPA